jgi:hypothetical protein
MTKPIFFDSVQAAVTHIVATSGGCRAFSDAIKGVDLNDAQQVNAFLMPQLLTVEQGVYMIKYPMANYAEFMPVDTAGTIWSAGSIFYSGDIAGKPEWFDVAADDMPYADMNRSQFLQENWMAAIGYKWNRLDLERGQQLGVNVLADKAGAATTSAERYIHNIAMNGDGLKFTSGFLTNPLATTVTAGAAITATSSGTSDVAVVNTALTSVETNTNETYRADTVAMPTSTYNILASKPMPNTGMSVLAYLQQSSVIGAANIKRTFRLETAGAGGTRRMIAYANNRDVHRFHLPGGGHQLFNSQPYQKGPFSWEVPGLMAIGGYENRIPKAITFTDGI